MTATPRTRLAPTIGCLVGVLLAGTLVLASGPASGEREVGAAVSAYANQTGELAVEPAGPASFLDAPELRPGASARGSFQVTNQTGRAEAIRPKAVPSSHDLDHSLRVEIASAGRTFSSGPLGSMTERPGDRVVLRPGKSAAIDVTVSLPIDTGPEAAAALVEIAIVFETGTLETNGGTAG